ncbi:PAS/PAC sensor signal transduction histidine kinase [Desulfuromonas soudanensis]|uniref:histidine kinase n=1 Tax=Desulfuromonas soudanensis TaxID=1603606 RepID=A0A0M3QG79_9BACT|nr:ATP-binding protein [Desulfuromonas soudanensis]ALC17343.1 PAS/PAC sensor signal transduction histidine kinase [Desulfuromonas soudanensis]
MRSTLRRKILLVLVTLMVIFGATVAISIQLSVAFSLRRELEKRGISIAKHLAQQSINSVLARDRLALRIAAANQKKIEEDIVYIYFEGISPGEILGHSFGDTFPSALMETRRLPPGQTHGIRRILTEFGTVYDIAAPIAHGGLGEVHLGLSASSVENSASEIAREILVITLLVTGAGILLAIPLSAAIAGPIRRLTDIAEAVAEGDLDQQIPPGGRDEIGQLSRSFSHMLQELRKSRENLLAGYRDLAAEVQRRQLAENQLATQLNFLSTLMDELPSPVFFKDTAGRFLGCNRAFEDFLGRSRDEIIGRTTFDLVPEEEARIHAKQDSGVFASQKGCSYEEQFTSTDGAVRKVLFHKATFNDERGELAGLVGILVDITAEREIAALRREFVSTAAHEFQTPLAAILGFSELLSDSANLTEELRCEYLAIVQERAEFLSRQVDKLLNVSRLENGGTLPLTLGPCPMDQLILQSLRSHQQTVRTHRFEWSLPSPCPPVTGDRDRITQVLDNLLGNAVKYTPKGGTIRVAAAFTAQALEVCIADEGPGLAPEHLERIFEKFYRVTNHDAAPSGTGLGLYLCRAIIEAHGGTIVAESTLNQGTRLSFSLPLIPSLQNPSP